jgi:predicted  nucleic acid-binding Zn-ribbon protein
MMSNHLFLNRLRIVAENGAVAYDEQFHKGVNIIRGDNSSGKSTITHFIFYVLGGDFSEFVPEARKCATVFAEVEMNDAVFTVKRDIIRGEEGNITKRVPMSFFFGNMNESLTPSADKIWQRYGYNTTENRKSFSNVLFDFLGLPIVKGDANITFHQILRLLYIDQDSPTNSLFYYEQFDSQLTRETVSDLLLGVYNEELYEKKKRLISAEKELDETKSEIKATKNFLPKDLLAPNFIKAHIDSKKKEIATKQDEIIAIRQKNKNILYEQNSKLNFQKLNKDTIAQRQKVAELEEQISLLHNEIEDSEFFIKTLNKKIEALRNSIRTREFLGHLPLEYCPECLTKIKNNEDKSVCKLCKEPIDQSYGVVQAKRMELEIGFQINESQKLIELNKKIFWNQKQNIPQK